MSSEVKNIPALLSRFDIIGHTLLAASLTLLLLPMTLSTYPFQSWTSPAKLSMIIIGGCCFIVFSIYELYVSSHPIVPFELAKDRTVAAGCIIQFVLYLSYYIWAPYFFSFIVIVNNQSAKAATNITASQAVATAVIGLLAAFVIKLIGVYKWAILLGMILKLIGAGLMLRYSNMSATIVQILFGQLISGAGTGLISIIAQTAVQAVTKREGMKNLLIPKHKSHWKLINKPFYADVASVTTLYEVSGAIGGAIGNALSGIIWTALLLPRLRINLPAESQSAATEIKNSFVVASSYAPGSLERIAIDKSYTEVMHVLLILALAVLAVPFVAVFAMKEVNLKKRK
jgi:hypothetical protein